MSSYVTETDEVTYKFQISSDTFPDTFSISPQNEPFSGERVRGVSALPTNSIINTEYYGFCLNTLESSTFVTTASRLVQ